MTRIDILRRAFDRTMALIEIGPSYSPVIPKSDGWRTTIIDHATRAELVQKYAEQPTSNIEEVDYVWRDGSLLDAVPAHLHGTFDGLIASHVAEHVPDLIGFFQTAATLLKPTGTLVLALPDKRLCFDFFQPLSTLGNVIDGRGKTRHSQGVLLDNAAYHALKGGGWDPHDTQPVTLANAFDATREYLIPDRSGVYRDSHAWRFTPASFQLLMLELNLLHLIPWSITQLQPAAAVEFYAWMQRAEIQLPSNEITLRRLSLLRETVLETKEQVNQLEPPPNPDSATPLISAIIPLFNGAKFIESTLQSVLAQTLPPCEIIVVDDGSTDTGPSLVRAMAQQYPITLLSKTNGGQSSARNFGVAHSRGDLIALLDQDDQWYPRHLEELSKPFLEPPEGAELGWVYSDLDECDEDGQMICHKKLKSENLSVHPKRDLINCLLQDMFVLPSASLISRKAFDAVGGFDERLSGYEDDDLFLRLFRAGYANVFLNTALSKWRIFTDSYSYTYRMRRSRAIYMRKLLSAYPDDERRSRYYTKHLILPRFYAHAVKEYRDALMSKDHARIEETRQELLYVVNQGDMTLRRRTLGRLLSRVRSPKAASMAFAARRYIRPVMRRLIS